MTHKARWINLSVGLAAAAFWVASGSMIAHHAERFDFLSFYTGGAIVRHTGFKGLYDLEILRTLQQTLVHDPEQIVPFTRPPLFALVMMPFTLFSLVPAFYVWLLFQIGALISCWIWACRRFGSDALVYCSLYFPSAYGIMHGQDNSWMLAVVLATFLLAERGRWAASGSVMALGLFKFHLFLLFPLAIALRKRWRMSIAFCLTGICEATLSFVLVGWNGIQQYYELERRPDLPVNPIPWTMLNVRAVLLNFGSTAKWAVALLAFLAIVLVVAGCRRALLWQWFAATTAGSLLISPHVYKYDATLLLLPILLAIFQSKSKLTRISAFVLAIPLPYLVALLGQPFAALPAILLFIFLFALARESYLELGAKEQLQVRLPVAA